MVPGTPPPPDTVFSSLGAVDLHSPTVPASGMFQGLRDMREALMLAWGWWGGRGHLGKWHAWLDPSVWCRIEGAHSGVPGPQ